MTDPSDQWIQSAVDVLRRHPEVERIEAGLSNTEIAAIEGRFGFAVPPDLRTFLQNVLPIGQRFPNWRDVGSSDLISRLDLPLDEIWFDVEHSDFWLAEWGSKPVDATSRFRVVKGAVEAAPRLIPIYAHRFIPSEPAQSGNPVFSVHQTDIIYYGYDLPDYLHREFKVPLPDRVALEPRPIRFWEASLRWRG